MALSSLPLCTANQIIIKARSSCLSSVVPQRFYSHVPATRPKDLTAFLFEKRGFPKHIAWSLFVCLLPPIFLYSRYGKRRKWALEDRDRSITDYVYVDIAKGDRYLGRMLLGVFGDTVPMTVHNFIRLIEGYKVGDKTIGYRNTKIHAIIPHKVILAGDVITGEGSDSLSIYGPMFPDENFSKSFLKRGDIAMYSAKPNANGSQFLITLKNYKEGNGRFVVFGTVVKGQEILRTIVADVNPSTKALDFSRAIEPVRIVSCGVYSNPSQGPPFYIADKEQRLERKMSFGTGHAWQPLSDIFTMGELARTAARRNMSTGREYEREIRDELRQDFKTYLEDRRKYNYLNGTPQQRKELHASVFQEEYRRRDLSLNRRLAYQRRQKLAEKALEEQKQNNET